MSIRKKAFSLVGALALSMTFAGGVASAEEPTSASTGISVTVVCGAANTGPSSVSLATNGDVTFSDFDPNAGMTSSRMQDKALRVQMDIDQCQTGAWHVDASITDFKSEADAIPGTHFQLPIDEASASLTAYDASGTSIPAVHAPSTVAVTFTGTGEPYASTHAIASTSGNATGTMFMDFTGEIVGLDAETPAGTFTAELTVTWSPGAP